MGLNRTDVFKNAQDPITATSGGSGDMLAANNLSELTNKATARTNLELGFLATTTNSIVGSYIANGTVVAAQVGTGSLTLSKLQTQADQRIIGNVAGSTTFLAALTATQVRTMIDTNTTPSTQTYGDAATVGTADTLARGDHKHAMPTGWIVVSATADQSIINSNTLTTSSYLSFAVSASTKYRVRGTIIADATAAGDFKYSITNPGSPTLIRYFESRAAAGATPAFTAPLAAFPAAVALTATTSNGIYITFDAIIHNGSNAGNVAFQFAQNSTTNDAGATVRAGAYIEYAIA